MSKQGNGEKVEFENNRVKVIRISTKPGEKKAARARRDRVLIWLTESHHTRKDSNGKKEELRRKSGEVVWRPASRHEVEHHQGQSGEFIMVEFKD